MLKTKADVVSLKCHHPTKNQAHHHCPQKNRKKIIKYLFVNIYVFKNYVNNKSIFQYFCGFTIEVIIKMFFISVWFMRDFNGAGVGLARWMDGWCEFMFTQTMGRSLKTQKTLNYSKKKKTKKKTTIKTTTKHQWPDFHIGTTTTTTQTTSICNCFAMVRLLHLHVFDLFPSLTHWSVAVSVCVCPCVCKLWLTRSQHLSHQTGLA